MNDPLREQLDAVKVSTLVEYLAARFGLERGELRFEVKAGRYERGRAVVSLGDLPARDRD
jgi:hypothetical protein